ncbi:hypothetical protein CL630_01725 [bacterium]|nr:hypothetical protein [bacterium]
MPLSTDTQNIIQNQFKTLPKDVQEAILSVDLRKNLQIITEKHNLHVDQAGALENETLFIMLGLEHPRDYIRNIMRELDIDTSAAKKLATDVNEQIFRPIRESLKKIHQVENAEQTQTSHGTDAEKTLGQETTVEQSSERQEPEIAGSVSETSMTKAEETVREAARGNIKIADEELARVHRKHQDAYKELSEQTPKPREIAPQPAPSLDLRTKTDTVQLSQKADTNTETPEKPAKPFFKITPQNIKEAVEEGKQKEVAPPENLPTVLDDLPIIETQPSSHHDEITESEGEHTTLSGISTMEQDIEHAKEIHDAPRTETTPEIPETPLGKIIKSKPEVKDSITEKLSGSFKLPRKETEYKVKEEPPKSEEGGDYGKIDPYREPVE